MGRVVGRVPPTHTYTHTHTHTQPSASLSGQKSKEAADEVYAAALVILGWVGMAHRLTDMTDAEVSLTDAPTIAAMLMAQVQAAGHEAGSCPSPDKRDQTHALARVTVH